MPFLKTPDSREKPFSAVRMEVEKQGDIDCKWDAPKNQEFDSKFISQAEIDDLEFEYSLRVVSVPGGFVKLDKLMEQDPIYEKTKITKTEHTIPWKEIEDSIKVYRNYMIIVTADVTNRKFEEGKLLWTAEGQNCHTFGYYQQDAAKFKACNEDDPDYEDKEPVLITETPSKEKPFKVTIGSSMPEKAFPLYLTSIKHATEDENEPTYKGEGFVVWSPQIGGSACNLKIAVEFSKISINSAKQVISGKVTSKEKTDMSWIPYSAIDFVEQKTMGYLNEQEWYTSAVSSIESAMDKVMDGIDLVGKNLDEAKDAIMGKLREGVSALDDATNNYANLDGLYDQYVSAYVSQYTASGAIDQAKEMAANKVKEYTNKYCSAEGIKELCGDYWKYISAGGEMANNVFQIVDGFMDEDLKSDPIVLPLRLPSNYWDNDPYYDISMMKMELTPVSAQVGALVLYNMPASVADVVEGGGESKRILAFSAPRLCITPNSLLPTTGEAGLLYDLKLKDGDSDFTFTFKGTTIWDSDDMNGCAVHWNKGEKDYFISLEADMTIPGILNKEGTAAPKCSVGGKLHIGGGEKSGSWSAKVNMEPFTIPDVDGFVFYPGGNVLLDMSKYDNCGLKIPTPKDYDWTDWIGATDTGRDTMAVVWQGLYIEKLAVDFPISFSVGDGIDEDEKENFQIAIEKVFVDKTGFTMTAAVKNLFEARTGKLGGWGFSVKDVGLNILQSNFRDSYFAGEIDVPLIEGDIAYRCELALLPKTSARELEMSAEKYIKEGNLLNSESKKANETEGDRVFHLIFRTEVADSMYVDMGFATTWVNKNGTWFEVDYLEGNGTDIELMLSGTLTLGGSDKSNGDHTSSKFSSIPFDIPGVRFSGMRIANFSAKEKNADGKSYAELFADKYIKSFHKDKGWQGWNIFDEGMSEGDYIKRVQNDMHQNELSVGENFFFGYGSWSLASMEKTIFGIPFVLEDFGFGKKEGTENVYQLSVCGGVGLIPIGGKDADGNAKTALGGTIGLSVGASLDMTGGIKNISKWKFDFDGVEFDSLKIKGSFGSGAVEVEGCLVIDTGDKGASAEGISAPSRKGFQGNLKLVVSGMFDMQVGAGYYEVDEGGDNGSYKSLYMAAAVGAGKAGIQLGGGVSLIELGGGFYINYALKDGTDVTNYEGLKNAIMTPEIKKGATGGAFCLGLAWGGADAVSAKLAMTVTYDQEADRLGQLRMVGDMEAVSGMVKAKCQITYENNTKYEKDGKMVLPNTYTGDKDIYNDCKFFKLNISVDASADITKAACDFLGMDGDELIAKLEGVAKLANCGDIDQMGQDGADREPGETSANEGKEAGDGDKSDKKATEGLKCDAGVNISLEFEYREYSNNTRKWHLYLGEPDYDKRCRLTWYDLKVGKKPAMIHALAFADAYLCFGNELPTVGGVKGGLPDLPPEVKKFLDGEPSDKSVTVPSGQMSALEAARQEVLTKGPGSGLDIAGGLQFGARIGCDFDCYAVIAHLNMGAQLGFDAVLKKFKDGCLCSDGSKLGGKKGYYAMAQLYAYAYGRLGLYFHFGFADAEFNLASLEFGAMLKGGFPNPSWAYGKIRAKGSVLGGLIKFNKAVEMKIGKVCVPMVGDPLSTVEIFGDWGVGDTTYVQGWDVKNAIDPGSVVTYATNMEMENKITLLDENILNTELNSLDEPTEAQVKQANIKAARYYRFSQQPVEFRVHRGDEHNQSLSNYDKYQVRTNSKDQLNFEVLTGSLEPHKYYSVHMEGFAQEFRDGDWKNPLIRDVTTGEERVEYWGQELNVYFCTTGLSPDMTKYVKMITPFDETDVPLEEVKKPMLSLSQDYSNFVSDNPDENLYASLEVEKTDANGKRVWWAPDLEVGVTSGSKYSKLAVYTDVEEGDDQYGNAYRFYLLRPAAIDESLKILPNTRYRWTFYTLNDKGLEN